MTTAMDDDRCARKLIDCLASNTRSTYGRRYGVAFGEEVRIERVHFAQKQTPRPRKK